MNNPVSESPAASVGNVPREASDNDQSKFRWNETETVVASVQAIAVYLNPRGQVVIRQEAGPLEQDDSFVILSPSHVKALITALRNLKP